MKDKEINFQIKIWQCKKKLNQVVKENSEN